MVVSPSYILDGIRGISGFTQRTLDLQDRAVLYRRDRVLVDCRSMFHVVEDSQTGEWTSKLPTEAQSAYSSILTSIIDRHIIGNFQNITSNQYKGCFLFFKTVRDEMPVSLSVLRDGILAHYDTWLSPICYPQLTEATSAETVHSVLKEIQKRKVVDYYDRSYDLYGRRKVPYSDIMTLGEFAAYRLIMSHGTIQDLIHPDTLAVLQRALVIHRSVVPFASGDETLTHLIHNLATFRTNEDLEGFCADVVRTYASELDLFS